jgi:hypothetical protein
MSGKAESGNSSCGRMILIILTGLWMVASWLGGERIGDKLFIFFILLGILFLSLLKGK